MKRREAIAATGAVLSSGIAGCSLPWDTITKRTGGVNLMPGQYREFNLDVEEEATIDYTMEVSTGPGIDALWMDRESFDEYEAENYDAVSYDSALSVVGATFADESGDLTPGKYTLLLDNTENIGAEPPSSDARAILSLDYVLSRR